MISLGNTQWNFKPEGDESITKKTPVYVDMDIIIQNTYFELFIEVLEFLHNLRKLGAFKESFPTQTEVMVDVSQALARIYSQGEMDSSSPFQAGYVYEENGYSIDVHLPCWEWKAAKKFLKLYGYDAKYLRKQAIINENAIRMVAKQVDPTEIQGESDASRS